MLKLMKSFNIQIGDHKIKDAGEKIGSLFGEEGRQIGKCVDDLTKNITIKIEDIET